MSVTPRSILSAGAIALCLLVLISNSRAETEWELRQEGRAKVIAKASRLAEGVYIFQKVLPGKYYVTVKYNDKVYSTAKARNPFPVVVKKLTKAEEDIRKDQQNPQGGNPNLRYEWANSPLIVQLTVQGTSIGARILTR